MSEKQEIIQKIEELRNLMHLLMNQSETLTNSELVEISQELDKLLNQYNRLLMSE
ncbi:spo0E like sporulation regulatory family protein [Clostridium argentinense CDC 2741]|uniref:Spo0E like sporulation regulatory family protein n=1 Tax=Clostridium argentinense CDC 2741 TaxID=1418104 RepID=A0A0C1R4A1_9CLOT|nr:MULTISPECIES: aspartyl-phosphate phosphatase Spo0E family protein [Clostridium]ARC84918.1 Spo0E family sporulation regulatory protein-aspartic acid phosphatase [Clostridium argentinense]KIE48347.1 spo0E like sporulation regulatory family protein [Clostridium argentinense CDC 2741]NFF40703.1 aspartyl-phosphate phosphatase Spo0E family protein [Clostridium argentinense]NFP51950.1 aspartyl-phosphate phosphatase Spo0E family protein [Clostridium argentinense]NFP73872.1 aspartyl-phosphate phosph